MSLEVLSLSALSLGFLHGLGADHLMAVAALSVGGADGGRRRRAVGTAVGFACGHALVLGAGAVAALLFGLAVPATVAAGGERVGGALLIGLGGAGVWSVLSGRAYGHFHHNGSPPSWWHLHFGPRAAHPARGHAHRSLPAILGAVFAVSSLRALMLLEPFGGDRGALALPDALLLVALFGLGILASMSLFGVVLARVLSARQMERSGQLAAGAVALASIALGVYWLGA